MNSKKMIKLHRIRAIQWFLGAVIFLAVITGLFEWGYADKYYPGVVIAGQSVAGKTYTQVSQEFKTKSEALQKNGLTLVFKKASGQTKIIIPKATAGLTSDTIVEYFSITDLQPDIKSAFTLGRQGNIWQRLQEQLGLVLAGKTINSSVSGHKEAIESLLSRKTKSFLNVQEPARFSFDKNNTLVITPEKLGDNIDVQKATLMVMQKLDTFDFEPIIFNVQTQTPETTAKKLAPFLALAKEFAKSANVKFYYQKHTWNVSGKTLVTWFMLRQDGQMTIDTKKLEAFLSTSVVPLINNPPQNSRFEMKDGKLVEISPGKPGNAVNITKTVELIEGIIPKLQQAFINTGNLTAGLVASNSTITVDQQDNTIDVPIEIIKVEAQVTQKTVDQYHIKDLVGYARTNFSGGSLDRQHNIEVGVSKMTGMLIAPGQEFSTVKAIGQITEEAGFVKEYVITGDETVKELGGGLCQLATTLFRTAINGGLPITERVNHAYVIPYYGPGLDATIYGPHPDFRFVNDTGNYLLLQGTAKNNEVIFELYGVADGRVATVSTPVLSDEKPVPDPRYIMSDTLPLGKTSCTIATHKGITADATYTVHYADGTVKENMFHSVYEPWPQICSVGTSAVLLQ